jgi:DNA-binding NarL/FixJ family response regulator
LTSYDINGSSVERRLSRRIRVLLVDDHAIMRAGLRQVLELEPDMEVVGEAADGEVAPDLRAS